MAASIALVLQKLVDITNANAITAVVHVPLNISSSATGAFIALKFPRPLARKETQWQMRTTAEQCAPGSINPRVGIERAKRRKHNSFRYFKGLLCRLIF
jgi:hypothetical protein